jgi:four helix bundle protein
MAITNYTEWLETIPEVIKGDSLWNMEAYRLALFTSDISWFDATRLMQDKRTLDLPDQLYRAVGSISANIAEGYSRSTGKDRAKFYEYALGSARESRDWYYKARHILGEEITHHRLNFMTQIIRLLTIMVPQQRASSGIRESRASYDISNDALLNNVPLP